MSGSNDKDNKLNPELGLWYGVVKITKHGGLDLETVHALYITIASSFFTRHFGVLTQFLNPGNSIIKGLVYRIRPNYKEFYNIFEIQGQGKDRCRKHRRETKKEEIPSPIQA